MLVQQNRRIVTRDDEPMRCKRNACAERKQGADGVGDELVRERICRGTHRKDVDEYEDAF